MTWDDLRLAVGAFMASSGFGGVSALCAALLALRGVRERLSGDRELAAEERREAQSRAHENDRRNRWWELAQWIDSQSDTHALAIDDLLTMVEQLEVAVTTSEQTVMVECLVRKVLGGAS